MAVRTYVTAGAAFAVAGVMALTPAIVPQLTSHDERVVKGVAVKLAANDYQSIVNTFFGKYPGNTDAPGFYGTPGVAYQYLSSIAGTDQAAQDLLSGYFGVGISEVVRQYLIASTIPDSPQATLINGYFSGGITEVAHLLTLANTTDPALVPYINTFYDQNQPNPALKGIPGVIFLRLAAAAQAGDLTPEQFGVINDFFQGGATQVVLSQLLARTSDPQQVQTINDFFTGGATQVVRTQLLSRTTDPNQRADILAFFPDVATGYEGGISENVRLRLLAASADPAQRDLINGFFDEGIAEVVRYLLVGPAPTPPEDLSRTAVSTAAVDTAPAETDVQVDKGKAAPLQMSAIRFAPQAIQASAPQAVPAPEATAAPAVIADVAPAPVVAATPPAPVVAATPDPGPTPTSGVKEKTGGTGATDLSDGNKAVVDPIIIPGSGGKAKPGEGSWGVFGQVADALSKGLTGGGSASSTTGASSASEGGSGS